MKAVMSKTRRRHERADERTAHHACRSGHAGSSEAVCRDRSFGDGVRWRSSNTDVLQ